MFLGDLLIVRRSTYDLVVREKAMYIFGSNVGTTTYCKGLSHTAVSVTINTTGVPRTSLALA